ncbi:chorismate-binding protein [Xanthomarina sp. F1114]|uniref:chorismate-binding protein n=1 Tax=Xanthomarina sp. F1114 TaxID=2996019 RepID=UPI00225E07CF|nr:chorismate-binding protein [Xanthomarina sp. F1114]MCX7547404.1 chorismate-binding protein [Xanthomarina sp. F1114]
MISDEFFQNIQQQLIEQLPFVVYRKPKEAEVKAMLQETNKLYTIKDYSEEGFVFAPFDSTKLSVLIPVKDSLTITCGSVNLNLFTKQSRVNAGVEAAQNTEAAHKYHIELVQKGIDVIEEKLFQKVVLSRCEKVGLKDVNPLDTLKSLLQNYPTAFVYCWYHPKIGLWLGATPESLIATEGSRFKTMALAGTQKFEGTEDVLWQNKEKEEQQFVTDFILQNLEGATENVHTSDVKTVKAGNLLHLQTNISGILNFKNSSFKELLNQLHPTPAVCGMPKEEAKQFIIKEENYNREFYTGFLGELNLKQKTSRNTNRRNVENNAYASIRKVSSLFVNLRCMQILDGNALIYVGGGITKDSNPEAEWQETRAKSLVMKKVLQ